MPVEHSATCLDVHLDGQIKRHPGVCRAPELGDRLDSRVHGDDRCCPGQYARL
jgi:hypothetical protein